jgi:hypothetical protein
MLLSIVIICEILTTESLGNPDKLLVKIKFPGASESFKFDVIYWTPNLGQQS